jgi:hypothetical protein
VGAAVAERGSPKVSRETDRVANSCPTAAALRWTRGVSGTAHIEVSGAVACHARPTGLAPEPDLTADGLPYHPVCGQCLKVLGRLRGSPVRFATARELRPWQKRHLSASDLDVRRLARLMFAGSDRRPLWQRALAARASTSTRPGRP